MKAALAIAIAVHFPATCFAQLSQEEALALLGKAGIATMTPIKAELCNWEDGNMTWDVLRQIAAMQSITSSEFAGRLNMQQRLSAVGTVTTPRATEMHRQIVQLTLKNKPCSDESVPDNPKTWKDTLEKYRKFAEAQIGDTKASEPSAASSSSQK